MGFSLRKTIDKVCVGLCTIGLDARVVQGRRPEWEDTLGWVLGQPLGLIEIRNSPIRWVNVIREKSYVGLGQSGGSDEIVYRNVCMVPDPLMSSKSRYRLIESTQVKSSPLFGQVVDIRWKCESYDKFIRRLSEDTLLNRGLIKLKENVTIRSFLEYTCWSISSNKTSTGNIPWILFACPAPSRAQWDCYETIARHLLESSRK